MTRREPSLRIVTAALIGFTALLAGCGDDKEIRTTTTTERTTTTSPDGPSSSTMTSHTVTKEK